MISKNCWSEHSFALLLQFLRHRVWLIALSALVFFFVYPVAAALVLQKYMEELALNGADSMARADALNHVVTQVLPELLGGGYWGAKIALILLALVAGCSLFRYLFDRRQVDFYHSQPIPRARLYGMRLFVGALTVLVPYLLMLLAAVMVVAIYGFFGQISWGVLLTGVCCHLLGFLAVYSTVALAGILTGHGVIQGIMSAFLLLIAPLLAQTVLSAADWFYDTFASGYYDLVNVMSALSPLIRYGAEGMSKSFSWLTAVALIVYIVAVILISLLLYNRRPSEAAGSAWAFRWCRPLVKYPLLVLATFDGGLLFAVIAGSSGGLSFWMIFGFVVIGVVTGRITEIVSDFDFNAIKLHWRGGLIFALLFAVIIAIPAFDLTHYDDYIPERSKVVSARVDVEALRELGNDSGSWNGRDSLSRCEVTGKAELDAILATAADVIATNQSHPQEYRECVQYNGDCEDTYTPFDVIYTLDSGRKVARSYYEVNRETLLPMVETLLTGDEYRANRLTALDRASLLPTSMCNLKDDTEIQFMDSLPTGEQKALQTQMNEALRNDIKNASLEDWREPPVAVIYYQDDGVYQMVDIPVYPSYENTLALLAELDVTPLLTPEMEEIDYIEYTGWSQNSGEEQYKTITDPDECASLLASTVSGSVFNYSFFIVQQKFDVVCHVYSSQGFYSDRYFYRTL